MSFTVKVTQYYQFDKQSILEALQEQNVLCTYNGKSGCMCGCRGEYSILEESRAEAEKDRGYAYDDEQVRPRAVTMALNRMRNYIKQHTDDELQVAIDKGEFNISPSWQYVGTDIGGRNHSIYFNKRIRKD